MRIITDNADGTLRYCYTATPGMSFRLSLLSEVGQPWQQEARAMREKFGDVVTVELPGRPWVADCKRSVATARGYKGQDNA